MDFPILPGQGGLPKLVLTAGDGAHAEIYLYGAHVTSWYPAGSSDDRLFVSAKTRFAAGATIRGGVPVCFPQFAVQGPLPLHGFVRLATWAFVGAGRDDAGGATALLSIADSEATRELWPHAFCAELSVSVAGPMLAIALAVTNPGRTKFEFTGALHSYLRVVDLAQTTVHGLQHAQYRDKVLERNDVVETEPALRFDRFIDRVYHAAPENLVLREATRGMAIRANGFPDTVVWNPGPEGEAKFNDLEAGGHRKFVCVEAAVARAPATVEPGDTWRGSQTLTAH